MAAPSVQSVGTKTWASATTVVIPKPTSLAENDLMVACVAMDGDAGQTITPPGGWTAVRAATSAADGSTIYIHCFYKVASAGDAAATDFTFTLSGTYQGAGCILRITGYHSANIIDVSDDGSNVDAGATFTGGITPTQTNVLLVMAIAGQFVANGASTSNYAIVTDNPTWTEQFDNSTDTADNYAIAVATAPRTQTTATGNFSATMSSVAETDTVGQLFAVNGTVDATVALTGVNIPIVANALVGALVIPLTLASLPVVSNTITAATEAAEWVNTTKNSATMTNTTKNAATMTNTAKNAATFTNTSKT